MGACCVLHVFTVYVVCVTARMIRVRRLVDQLYNDQRSLERLLAGDLMPLPVCD